MAALNSRKQRYPIDVIASSISRRSRIKTLSEQGNPIRSSWTSRVQEERALLFRFDVHRHQLAVRLNHVKHELGNVTASMGGRYDAREPRVPQQPFKGFGVVEIESADRLKHQQVCGHHNGFTRRI